MSLSRLLKACSIVETDPVCEILPFQKARQSNNSQTLSNLNNRFLYNCSLQDMPALSDDRMILNLQESFESSGCARILMKGPSKTIKNHILDSLQTKIWVYKGSQEQKSVRIWERTCTTEVIIYLTVVYLTNMTEGQKEINPRNNTSFIAKCSESVTALMMFVWLLMDPVTIWIDIWGQKGDL